MLRGTKLIISCIFLLLTIFGNFNPLGTIGFGIIAGIFYLEFRLDGKVDKEDIENKEEQISESDRTTDEVSSS